MGSDSHKAHDTYTIAPAPAAAALLEPPPAADVDDAIDQAGEAQPPGDASEAPAASDHAADIAGAAGDGAAAPPPGVEPLIPVPATAPAGDPRGVGLLVGGADLDDAAATLLAYHDPTGAREVLHARVTPDAEAKLLEALALSDEKLVPVTVDKQVSGRLPLDSDHQLHEQLEKIAKSVNHHLKASDAVPDHTHTGHASLVALLDDLDADPRRTDAEKAMLADYRAAADAIGERLAPGYALAYDAGGKVPHVGAYETTGVVKVTEMVPAPTDDPPQGLLATRVRKATASTPRSTPARSRGTARLAPRQAATSTSSTSATATPPYTGRTSLPPAGRPATTPTAARWSSSRHPAPGTGPSSSAASAVSTSSTAP